MPELPEVETVCRSLRPHLLGRTIKRMRVLEPRLRVPVDESARQALGRKARSKRLIDAPSIFCCSFSARPFGCFISACRASSSASSRTRRARKHDHIVVDLDDGGELRYHDPRRFGLSLVTRAMSCSELPQLRALGVDPFDADSHRRVSVSVSPAPRRGAFAISCSTSRSSPVSAIFTPTKFCR